MSKPAFPEDLLQANGEGFHIKDNINEFLVLVGIKIKAQVVKWNCKNSKIKDISK
eukprot:TRINITY_DN601_c0_g1_i1.p1 TRINITY_DN601_c0_g1~~TRINITY_DN601_c0_g1_i1.p1  ORF type:complete len:55 (-),score=6.09 TRINITY_DN601_c0_g1_i1:179-343(-)